MSLGRLLLTSLFGCLLLAPSPGLAQNDRPLALSAESVLLIDPSGRTLFAKNADADHAPASLVKLMTLYLAFDDLEAGRTQPDDLVTISHNAATTARYRMGLREGDRVPLHTVMEGVGIASANDAATALAEHLAGSEAAFVVRMNAKAAALGLTGTRFGNPHGLPHPAQRSNARDLATLTARLLEDHPDARSVLGGQTFDYRGRVYARNIPLFRDPGGVEALKTGFTREAGYNLSVAAWRGGQQFLMILLGARSRSLSFIDARKLLRYGFAEAGLALPPPPARRETVRREPTRREPARRVTVRRGAVRRETVRRDAARKPAHTRRATTRR
jgi:D-alanyl-D-alanine carboxypeptidase (penicillin-binding protein 5/6)